MVRGLAHLLVDVGVISSVADCPTGPALLALGIEHERMLARALSQRHGHPAAVLSASTLDLAVLRTVGREEATRLRLLPLERHAGALSAAVPDVEAFRKADELSLRVGARLSLHVAVPELIDDVLSRAFAALEMGQLLLVGPHSQHLEPHLTVVRASSDAAETDIARLLAGLSGPLGALRRSAEAKRSDALSREVIPLSAGPHQPSADEVAASAAARQTLELDLDTSLLEAAEAAPTPVAQQTLELDLNTELLEEEAALPADAPTDRAANPRASGTFDLPIDDQLLASIDSADREAPAAVAGALPEPAAPGPGARDTLDLLLDDALREVDGPSLPGETGHPRAAADLAVDGAHTPAVIAPPTVIGQLVVETRPRKPRVVVIEDDDAIRKMIETLLEKDGCEVRAAATGTAGVDLLRQGRPDLVVTDAMLPGVHGFEICSTIKHGAWRELPVVLVSAVYTGIEHARAVQEMLGADAFLQKPFHFREFRELVARLLGRRLHRAPVPALRQGEVFAVQDRFFRALEAGALTDALALVERWVGLDPFDATGHFEHGVLLEELDRDEEALRAFEAAVLYDPDLYAGLVRLAALYRRLGFTRKANAVFARARECAPDDASASEVAMVLARLESAT